MTKDMMDVVEGCSERRVGRKEGMISVEITTFGCL